MEKTPAYWRSRKEKLLNDLLSTPSSRLGFTEPTFCGRAGVRLHEAQPTSTASPDTRDPEALILRDAEYAAAQHRLGLPDATGHLALPHLVQYDLAHLTESLPESRARAATDRMHSFLDRKTAESTLLAHLTAYHRYGAVPCLVWHTFHPAHGDKSIYDLPEVDPFAGTDAPNEREILRALAECVHLSETERPSELSTTVELALRTVQAKLERIAAFAQALAERDIVAVFRPYHEANGHWFWWSIDRFADDGEEAAALFRQLWQNTRRYLEDRGVHNLLYAWSPNIAADWFAEDADLVARYLRGVDPDAIDIFGIDCYSNNLRPAEVELIGRRREILLKGLNAVAELQRRFPTKPVGFTELGLRYHEVFARDTEAHPPGHARRGGGTLNRPFLRRFSRWSGHAPHFTIFWRNEPHALEFPVAGLSAEMDAEVVGVFENFATISVRVDDPS